MAETGDGKSAPNWVAIGAFLVGAVVGLSAGIAIGVLISPYIFPPSSGM